MFSPDARITSRAEQDRLLRQRAVEEAGTLFVRDGAAAIAHVSRELRDPDFTADERRYHRLVIVELERLDRLARRGSVSGHSAIGALFGNLLSPSGPA